MRQPDARQDAERLATFIRNFGYRTRIGGRRRFIPSELQKLLAQDRGYAGGADDQPSDSAFDEAGRSMPRTARGHFGLAAPYYCHFHLSDPALSGSADSSDYQGGAAAARMKEDRIHHYDRDASGSGRALTSKTERRADEAERDTRKNEKGRVYGSSISGRSTMQSFQALLSFGIYAGASKYGGGTDPCVASCMTTATITKRRLTEMYGIDTGRVFRAG